MKNRKIKFISILFLLIFTSLPILAQEFVYVSVEKADLQNDTGALAEKISELSYGTKLLVLENTIEDKWIKVALNNNKEISGWILSENVTKRRIVKAIKKFGSVDSESALAGKGNKIDLSNSSNKTFKKID